MGEIMRDRSNEVKRRLCGDLALWQQAGIGMFILALLSNTILLGLYYTSQEQWQQENAQLQSEIQQVERTRDLAVRELGALARSIAEDEEARAVQAEAYSAVGTWQYIGECTLTAYCCEAYPHICGTGDGLTATGCPVSPGVVAVDPDVIPLGSTVVIDGRRYLAADTGAAVKGLRVDIAVPTHTEAETFGAQKADVWVIPQEGGVGHDQQAD